MSGSNPVDDHSQHTEAKPIRLRAWLGFTPLLSSPRRAVHFKAPNFLLQQIFRCCELLNLALEGLAAASLSVLVLDRRQPVPTVDAGAQVLE